MKDAGMIRKILLPLDGSENSESAFQWLKRFAGPGISLVTLFRAIHPEDRPTEAREYLMRYERELNYAGIPAQVRVGYGDPSKAILRAAMSEACSMILMATRGGSPVKRWILGGVTEKVLRLSPVPVLIVQSGTKFPKKGRIGRLLIPLDGSKLADAILPWAEEMARFLRARTVFLHVRRPLGTRREELAALRKRVVRQELRLKERGLTAEFRILHGDPALTILEESRPGDLIATTTHGAGGFKRMLLGSVAEKLIHQSEVPVVAYKTAAQVWPRVLREV